MVRHLLRTSKTLNMVRRVGQRVQSIAADSWLVQRVPWPSRPTRESLPNGDSTLSGRTVTRNAAIGRLARRCSAGLGTAGRHSVLRTNLATTMRRYIEGSWLYRWLTAEPDPDVIVIDLRETVTVGPWLAAIERGIRWLLPATAWSALFGFGRKTHHLVTKRPIQLGSLLLGTVAILLTSSALVGGEPSRPILAVAIVFLLVAILGSQVTWTWAEVRETRIYQGLAAAFEPPEPPERHDDTPLGSDTGTRAESGDESSDSTETPPRSDSEER